MIQGTAPNLGQGGAYYWTALFRDGQMVKRSSPRFVAAGDYNGVSLEIRLESQELETNFYEAYVYANGTLAEAEQGLYSQRGIESGPHRVYIGATAASDEPCPLEILDLQIGNPQNFYAYADPANSSLVRVLTYPDNSLTPVLVDWDLVEYSPSGTPARALITEFTTSATITPLHPTTIFKKCFLDVTSVATNRCQRVMEIGVRGWDVITVEYRAFIGCAALSNPVGFFWGEHDYLGGDNRSFMAHPPDTASRFRTRAVVTTDPSSTTDGEILTQVGFGYSHGYDASAISGPSAASCDGLCFNVDGSHACRELPANGNSHFDGALITSVTVEVAQPLQGFAETEITFYATAFPECIENDAVPVAGIDASIVVTIYQLHESSPAMYSINGNHDQFPWHEIYINGVQASQTFGVPFDPCEEDTSPLYLLESAPDHLVSGSFQEVP